MFSARRCESQSLSTMHTHVSVQRDVYTSTAVTGAVESLFVLARIAFVLNNPDTYIRARTYLERAVALVSNASQAVDRPQSSRLAGSQLANYTRCIAGAYYNFAVQLHQSTRLAHAVPFLEAACEHAERALTKYKDAVRAGEPAEGDGKKDVWQQLEEQLYRRWELLGVCHAKTGDRQVSTFALSL